MVVICVGRFLGVKLEAERDVSDNDPGRKHVIWQDAVHPPVLRSSKAVDSGSLSYARLSIVECDQAAFIWELYLVWCWCFLFLIWPWRQRVEIDAPVTWFPFFHLPNFDWNIVRCYTKQGRRLALPESPLKSFGKDFFWFRRLHVVIFQQILVLSNCSTLPWLPFHMLLIVLTDICSLSFAHRNSQ